MSTHTTEEENVQDPAQTTAATQPADPGGIDMNQLLLASVLSGRGVGFNPLTKEQQRKQGLVRTGAGLADFFMGRRDQRLAEQQIDELGAQQEDLVQQFKDLSAPSLMDPNTVAAATRNAAILGGVPAQSDSSAELAAAKMAIEAGADPATIQRNLVQAQQMEAAQDADRANQAFQQGLGFAQTDAQTQFAEDQQNLMMDLNTVNEQLAAAQQESLMAQQQRQRGGQGLVQGISQFATNYEKGLAGDNAGFFKNLGANIFQAEEGMKVQKTPGEFDHDTNDMILMAPTEDGLVDTGIRQTGGEFVLNPEQAEGLEEAYDNVNPEEPTYEQLLALYEAARFLDEPQFDDDYVA